jgi:hypothetical protein
VSDFWSNCSDIPVLCLVSSFEFFPLAEKNIGSSQGQTLLNLHKKKKKLFFFDFFFPLSLDINTKRRRKKKKKYNLCGVVALLFLVCDR